MSAASATSPGRTVLVALLAYRVHDGGVRLSDQLRSAPVLRSTVARASSSVAAARRAADGSSTAPVRPRVTGGAHAGGVAVVLKDVAVTSGAVDVLDDVCLDISPGAHVAVVGPSGAGKTTLLGVVLGVVEPTAGVVTVDGVQQVGPVVGAAWVSPDVRLWNQSLAANVAYGEAVGGPAVERRLAVAEAGAVVERLERAGAPRLGEGGRLLSDGEAQRVRLARALGRPDATLVVLDEPFQGLERDRRRRLLGEARRWWAATTLVCATHDVADTVDFDHVVVVEGGRIVEAGSPTVLAATPASRYRRLLDAAAVEPFGPTWRRFRLEGHEAPTAAARAGTAAPAPSATPPGDVGVGPEGRRSTRLEPAPGAGKGPVTSPNHTEGRAGTRWRRSVVLWLGIAVVSGLAGTALLVEAARRLGELIYDGAGTSVLALAVPLVGAALLEATSVGAGGLAGVELSTRVRRRTLDHALHIDPDQVEVMGAGRALATALDAELVGSFLVTTAPAAILGLIELAVGAAVSSGLGDGSSRLLVIGAGVVALTATGRWVFVARRRWTIRRFALTAELVERLLGQRTVAVAERGREPAPTHPDEVDYEREGARLDTATLAASVVAYATTSALIVMAFRLEAVGRPGPEVGAAIGAALLVASGLLRMRRVTTDVAGAVVAARGVSVLAAMRAPAPVAAAAGAPAGVVVAAEGVTLTCPGANSSVFARIDLEVRQSDRLVVTGASGSGKTTLAELLDGRRAPTAGVVRHSPGATIARVPQAGDDHLFHASLLFNVVAATGWPPSPVAEDDAMAVLTDLGLGPLVARVPAGLLQPIGDGGWRLSAGEAARVRLARALVRRPDVVIVDETFAPLDAATFDSALAAAERWAGAVVVIAHT